jgi:glucosamine--fructose-6-phosphate aminotransferase (isomerizing)
MTETRSAHPYFLYDAIAQQPALIEQALLMNRSKIEQAVEAAAGRKRFTFVGIGTSFHGANIGERWMRHHSSGRAQARAEQSFEFVRYPLALGAEDAAIVLTHTGTTTQSIEALRAAKAAGAFTVAITGKKPGEGILGADFHFETCEQEVAFAYTKSYTTALAVMAVFILRLLERRGWVKDANAAVAALERVPALMLKVMRSEAQIHEIAKKIAERHRLVFFGAGLCWFTASEAALKVKETSYIAAEGFEMEEILHGPFSEIDSRAAMVALLSGEPADDRARTILRAAGELGTLRVAVAVPAANHDLAADHVIELPAVETWLAPFLHLLPLQLLTYYIALARGVNPDTGRQDQTAHARAHQVYKL